MLFLLRYCRTRFGKIGPEGAALQFSFQRAPFGLVSADRPEGQRQCCLDESPPTEPAARLRPSSSESTLPGEYREHNQTHHADICRCLAECNRHTCDKGCCRYDDAYTRAKSISRPVKKTVNCAPQLAAFVQLNSHREPRRRDHQSQYIDPHLACRFSPVMTTGSKSVSNRSRLP
jgi:hypothetical protein